MSTEILRKLTLKNCGLDKSTIAEALEGKKSIDILRVAGITTSATPGQTDLGAFVKFGGNFQAVNLLTGETFSSTVCILPNFIADTLAGALEQSLEVEFALAIGAKASKTVTGYEYTVRPLVEAQVNDKLGALLSAAGMDKPLALTGGKRAA